MRFFLIVIFLTALFTNGYPQTEKRPNIIFLLSDDQTSIATGCYGNDQVLTPNMDKLAAEGVRFINHYNTTAICMASRASILTGMYEYKTGCNFMHGDLAVDKFENSYPVLLQQAGYFTGMAGKIGFELDLAESDKIKNGLPAGYFDRWGGGPGQTHYTTSKNPTIAQYADEYPHSTRAYGAWAADFIHEAKKSGKPFCMSISFKAPHLPFTPDAYFDQVYAGKTYRKPDNYGADNATHLSPQAKSGRQYNSYTFWRDSDSTYQEAIRKYNQLIHGVDYALGMIRASLAKHGVDDNTIIIFTSDNGYSCGAHNLGGKVLPYEEASKSPLIIYDPRSPQKKQGITREAVTGNIDMAPTILQYAGLDIPKNMDGLALQQLIQKPKRFKREVLALMNMWGNDEIQALSVVSKDWKYIYWQYADERMQPTEELFHVGKDRLEMTNYATHPSYQDQLHNMRALYDRHLQHIADHAVNDNDYPKYATLFDRNAKPDEKQPYLTGTYEELSRQALKRKQERLAREQHDGMSSSEPASRWEDGLISGNGTMGILVMGDPEQEQIVFNHEFCYEPIGSEDIEPPMIAPYMPEIKRLLRAGKYREAHDYSIQMAQENGFQDILWTDPYHPSMQMLISQSPDGESENYLRSVDFETGEVSVTWQDERGKHTRKSFVSRPDEVVVQQLKGDAPLTCSIEISDLINLENIRRSQIPDDLFIEEPEVLVSDSWITFRQAYSLNERGYESGTKLIVTGGTSRIDGNRIQITKADEVLILTQINYLEDFSKSQLATTRQKLESLGSDYASLLGRHAAVHGEMYNRVDLDLQSDHPKTSEQFIAQQKVHTDSLDPAFLQAMFNMGRYTLISSSGKNPPNLMGIWNGEWRPVWSGDFTLDANVNLQISAANLGNTQEAIDSYMDMLERIAPDWETNAQRLFGCKGYLAGTRTSGRRNLHTHFSNTFPGHFWVAGAEWLLLPCFEYYQVSGDTAFLQNRLLPMMKKTVLFFEEFLTEYDENGQYVFVPSYSPENRPANSRASGATINAGMDIAAAKEAIVNLVSVCQELGIEQENIPRWEAMLEKMPPYLINSDGSLKEWATDQLEDYNAHRHVSHLYPAWPGLEINPEETPQLFEAAQKAALNRGRGNGSAHGLAHMALIGARLKMEELVYGNLLFMLKNDYIYRSLFTSHNPGIIYNSDMLNSLPAVVMEMLVYSRPGVIELLPACSPKLKKGRIKGVKCRTQATVENLEWNFVEKKISVTISSAKDQDLELMYRRGMQSVTCSLPILQQSDTSITLELTKGDRVEIEIQM